MTTYTPSLSKREDEYVHYLLEGLSDKRIAQRMGIGSGVYAIARNARYKLDAENRTELLAKALRLGVIELLVLITIFLPSFSGHQDFEAINRVPRARTTRAYRRSDLSSNISLSEIIGGRNA